MVNGLIGIVAIVIFAIVMALIKYSIAPTVADAGWIAVAAFLGVMFLIAYWIDRSEKRTADAYTKAAKSQHSKPDERDIIDAEFTVIEPETPIASPASENKSISVATALVVLAGIAVVTLLYFWNPTSTSYGTTSISSAYVERNGLTKETNDYLRNLAKSPPSLPPSKGPAR